MTVGQLIAMLNDSCVSHDTPIKLWDADIEEMAEVGGMIYGMGHVELLPTGYD